MESPSGGLCLCENPCRPSDFHNGSVRDEIIPLKVLLSLFVIQQC
jgi:hypothetical protein